MDIVEQLEGLCHPMTEALGEYSRINAFVKAGMEAAEEIRKLRAHREELFVNNEWGANEIARLVAENKRLKGLLENSEMTVAEVIDANERLRVALTEISMMRAEDMYRGDDDNAAAFIARTALAPPPQR